MRSSSRFTVQPNQFAPHAPALAIPSRAVLDEYTRRRVAAVLLVAGIVVAALAITDTWPFSDPPTEEELAEEAVVEFFAAAEQGDFASFCDGLTKGAQQSIEVRTAALAAEEGLKGCAEVLEAFVGDQFAGSELDITLSNVSGNRARVETELKLKGEPGRSQRTVLLEQSPGGDWLISDPGFG
jgi:hypothetical protein